MNIMFFIIKLKLCLLFTFFNGKTIFSFSLNYNYQQLLYIVFNLKDKNNIKRFRVYFKKYKKNNKKNIPHISNSINA